ncbi:MAG: GGDEF domain-containing protein [Gammaproteobacteria bacterium]|jgi:diguanylate cyclase (GGDEF)-like protein
MRFEVFPRDDPRMSLRLRRTLMGFFSYLMFTLPLAYAMRHGWVAFTWESLGAFLAVVTLANAGFFLLIRSGITRSWRDPSATLAQIAVAIVLALVVISRSHEARGIMLLLFYTSFFFGVFRLTTREFLGLALFAMAGYSLIIAWEYQNPVPGSNPQLEVLRFIVLGMLLVWVSFLGGYVARLRRRLSNRNAELKKALVTISELAVHDELTQAYNRRHLTHLLELECSRAARHGSHFSVCILDLDHFKQINDRFGHETGDRVLQRFTEVVGTEIRALDQLGRQDNDEQFGRYGGEEFLLLLPETDRAGAVRCAARIVTRVASTRFGDSQADIRMTVSAGVAQFRQGDSMAALLRRADRALYEAKAAGRNQVMAEVEASNSAASGESG